MLAAFRLDSGLYSGAGHMGRSLTLARELQRQGFEIAVFSRRQPGALDASIQLSGVKQIWMGDEGPRVGDQLWAQNEQVKDGELFLESLGGQSVDLLVVDHYGLSAPFESQVSAKKVFVFDDFCRADHCSDFVLNQAGGSETAYESHNQNPSVQVLLGPRYALVSPQVREARSRYSGTSKDKGILYFGSGQVGSYILETLPSLVAHGKWSFTVILSSEDPLFSQVKEQVESLPGWELHSRVENFPLLMESSALFVGANGATSWERCCIGVPTISFTLAENQKGIEKILKESGAGETLGDFGRESLALLPEALLRLSNPASVQEVIARAQKLCDGHGAERIVSEILKTGISYSS